MDRSGMMRQEMAEALRGFRLLLTSCRMAGMRDWPAPLTQPDPLPPEIGPAEPPVLSPEREGALAALAGKTVDCRHCRLHSGRLNVVFGEGSPRAKLAFVGEGPGFEEDQQGRPFVGRAGKLLDRMTKSLGLERADVYICNVVKCRPPENRTPSADEIDACSPFLFEQLEILKPRVICALGACAGQTLLASPSPVSRMRGKIHRWRGIPLVCTFHPAYLLRTPSQKAAAWQDLLEARRLLHRGDE